MAEEPTKTPVTQTTADAKPAKPVKVGDNVHLVHYTGEKASRFRVDHCNAKVVKVHEKGKFVDLVVDHEDPRKTLEINRSPRDDSGTQLDSWHPCEAE